MRCYYNKIDFERFNEDSLSRKAWYVENKNVVGTGFKYGVGANSWK